MQFFVPGIPTPQGSKQAFIRGGRAVIVDAGTSNSRSRHADWRSSVTLAARGAMGSQETLTGATGVTLDFLMPTVKCDPYRDMHTTTPDLDKLIRAVLDSLTNAGVIRDDSIVCDIQAHKRYVKRGEMCGVTVEVVDLAPLDVAMKVARKSQAKELKATIS